MSNTQELMLKIDGMHCGACVRRVTDALQKVPGVHVRSVDIGSARIEYEPEAATPQVISEAVEAIGFKVAATQ